MSKTASALLYSSIGFSFAVSSQCDDRPSQRLVIRKGPAQWVQNRPADAPLMTFDLDYFGDGRDAKLDGGHNIDAFVSAFFRYGDVLIAHGFQQVPR
jgi:hypothetical protein